MQELADQEEDQPNWNDEDWQWGEEGEEEYLDEMVDEETT